MAGGPVLRRYPRAVRVGHMASDREKGCFCSICTLITLCCFMLAICLLLYIPIMMNVKRVAPHFDWDVTADRNTSTYIRPQQNTTLIQPLGHSPGRCQPFLLIVVQSAVKNFQARDAIRQTWGSYADLYSDVLLLFLVGNVPNHTLSDNLHAENRVHGDIIQEDFVDVYSNLTLKTVMMLKWVSSNCVPDYVLKSDEDMFIHVPNLYTYLRDQGDREMITGALICNAHPLTDRFSKYYSPRYMYGASVFPNYVSGTSYVLGGGLIHRLLDAALATPLFHLEDVFLTGLCAKRVGVRPRDHPGFSYEKRRLDGCVFRRLISAHEVTPAHMQRVWSLLRAPGLEARCGAAGSNFTRSYRPSKCRW